PDDRSFGDRLAHLGHYDVSWHVECSGSFRVPRSTFRVLVLRSTFGSNEERGTRNEERAYICIAAPCAACAASPTPSDIVGCAWIVRISSSTVDSRRSARAASATSSVARRPIMWTPSTSSYFFSATILTRPSISPATFARPSTPNGKTPTRTS